MIDLSLTIVLVIVVCMMLGLIEVPEGGSRGTATPKNPKDTEKEKGKEKSLGAARQADEVASLRRRFKTRLQ